MNLKDKQEYAKKWIKDNLDRIGYGLLNEFLDDLLKDLEKETHLRIWDELTAEEDE